ncbi:hypothetical protein TNCV_403671 [Trichonephila clavipes]|nr:hypothetical protein TNCV_403671 [Trichonephila clavipes]
MARVPTSVLDVLKPISTDIGVQFQVGFIIISDSTPISDTLGRNIPIPMQTCGAMCTAEHSVRKDIIAPAVDDIGII